MRERERKRGTVSHLQRLPHGGKKVFFLMNALGENLWDQSILGE